MLDTYRLASYNVEINIRLCQSLMLLEDKEMQP